jgi:hypothetical protein
MSAYAYQPGISLVEALLTITEQAHVAKFWRDFGTAIAPALPYLGVETAE